MRIGIGIHAGPAVVGRMGWGESFYLTAVGDTVHVAARLEQATKDHGAELVVSEDVARHAGLDLSAFPRTTWRCATAPVGCGVRIITATSPTFRFSSHGRRHRTAKIATVSGDGVRYVEPLDPRRTSVR